jgi:hypothetical protein
MPKFSLSYKTTKRPKEPFDPALDDPIALTPDQLETVVGGLASLRGVGGIGTIIDPTTTFGLMAPPSTNGEGKFVTVPTRSTTPLP